MRAERSAKRLILGGAPATAFGFAIRFGARVAFFYVAARLLGLAFFGASSLAVAAVEIAVTIGGLGTLALLQHPASNCLLPVMANAAPNRGGVLKQNRVTGRPDP